LENLEAKQCKWCEEIKPLDDFYSQERFNAKGESYIYYNPECKECTKENAEKWRKNPENRESFLKIKNKRNRHHDHRNKEQVNAYKRRKKEGYFKKYYEENKEMFVMYNLMHSDHKISQDEWKMCKSYFDNSCAYCGKLESVHKIEFNQQLHKEHVKHDGANDLSNCVPSCKTCNVKKSNLTLEEFVERHYIDKERIDKINKWVKLDHKIYKEVLK